MGAPVTVIMSIISAAAVGVVGVGAAVVAVQPDEPVAADPISVVSRVVDGDTVDVLTDGTLHRVRLLNVNTPETKDPNKPVQCLGPQATEFLKRLLPQGKSVTLKYDVDRNDRYGRTLAAVFTADGTMVNAAIARAGLGIAQYVAPNDRYLSAVKAAQREAVASQRGLFSPKIECTVPGQIERVRDQVAAVPPGTGGSSLAQLTAAHKESSQAVVAALAMRQLFDKPHSSLVWRALDGSLKQQLATRARSLVKEARGTDRRIAKQIERKKAKAAKRRAAAKAEERRKAAAARAKKEAEARARAAAEREAQARREAEAQPPPAPAPRYTPEPRYTPKPKVDPAPAPRTTPEEAAPPEPPSGGYDGYTGCRAYGPHGTSIDEKGRRYTKIPCP